MATYEIDTYHVLATPMLVSYFELAAHQLAMGRITSKVP